MSGSRLLTDKRTRIGHIKGTGPQRDDLQGRAKRTNGQGFWLDQYERLCLARRCGIAYANEYDQRKLLLDKVIRACKTYRTGNARQFPAQATKGPTMSKTLPSQQEAAPPIRVIIIQPDSSYEIREIEQDIRTLQCLVGGHLRAVYTEWCTLWCDEDVIRHQRPTNHLATYLWWKVDPCAEGRGPLQGTVFVTGPADDFGDSLPIPNEVVDLFGRLEQIYREEGGK
jgi:Domain of unknown function (DUF3846)